MLSGCASLYRSPPTDLATRPDLADKLHVLHVSSDHQNASGYAVRNSVVVSAAHLFENGPPFGAVSGQPAILGTTPERAALDRNALPPVDDWLILSVLGEKFTPNNVDPAYRPQRGEKVYLGGFLMADARSATREEFLAMDPVIIEGESLGGPVEWPCYQGLWLVAVPLGSYDGYSGGPAACMDGAGQLKVWGTIVRYGPFVDGLLPRWSVAIAPLPPEVMTTILGRVYTK